MARYFDRIAARFKRQEQKGIAKYGQILEDNPRGLKEALEYAAEEVTDLLMYLEEAMEKVGATVSSCGISREIKEGMSDLKVDLELCSKATPGPWVWDCVFCGEPQQGLSSKETGARILWSYAQSYEDSEFIATAREGWPEAIRRAIEAEEHIEMLSNECDMCKNDKEAMALETISALRKENEALKSEMTMFRDMCENSPTQELDEKWYREKVAALREENEKLLAVVEAAKELADWESKLEDGIYNINCAPFIKLNQALADLEGGR